MENIQASPNIQICINGDMVTRPCVRAQNRTVISSGKWVKVAHILDEEWLEGPSLQDPEELLVQLKRSKLRADYFTFAQKFFDFKPHHPYHYNLDNVAAIPITSYEDWWERRVSHDLRKDVKRAEKRGLVIKAVEFNDDLVQGISQIYNETTDRQGRRFWHYGKDLVLVKSENATFLERSQFIGAFFEDKLIGFIKIVFTDDVARMMQILSMDAHQDKRPGNALIAKAVEIASSRGCSYLTYGRYTYDNKKNSSIVKYKRRNGFEEILYPRYYIPLTLRGSAIINAGLHRGLKRLIPEKLMYLLLDARAKSRDLISGKPKDALKIAKADPA